MSDKLQFVARPAIDKLKEPLIKSHNRGTWRDEICRRQSLAPAIDKLKHVARMELFGHLTVSVTNASPIKPSTLIQGEVP